MTIAGTLSTAVVVVGIAVVKISAVTLISTPGHGWDRWDRAGAVGTIRSWGLVLGLLLALGPIHQRGRDRRGKGFDLAVLHGGGQ
jgi:hypothetical protein